MDALLAILRDKIPNIPKSSKTLLQTPTQKTVTKTLSNNGKYWHFGLKNIFEAIAFCGISLPALIELKINIDGIPIFNSSTSQCWPILCSIKNVSLKPMVIGIYCGETKPGKIGDSVATDEYLGVFILEASSMYVDGFYIDDVHYTVKILVFINDIPASALVKKTKGHTGRCSCTKCDTLGIRFSNSRSVSFPHVGNPRTNESFREQSQIEHHNGTSPLVELPYLDMVRDFPCEYMHLLCLGVQKKNLTLWTSGSQPYSLTTVQRQNIEKELKSITSYFPSDFNRKHLDLSEVTRWKATQFRTFLLYVGIVVLKDNINEDIYNHAILLHVATTICMVEDYFIHLDLAHKMFLDYIKVFSHIYGSHMVSINIHNLAHVTEDVKRFGKLDNFSAFPFENKLGEIKRLLRSGNKPLEQIANRIHESFNADLYNQAKDMKTKKQCTSTYVELKDFSLKRDDTNCWFLTNDKRIYMFERAENKNGNIYITCKMIINYGNFYEKPIDSR